MPPRWLPTVVARIRELAAERKVRFTIKALRELATLDLGLDEDDACHVLVHLAGSDFAERLVSTQTGERMYVFTPTVGEAIVYVKLLLRNNHCVVISFHEKEAQSDEDA